jgi:hypothetical protein
LYKVVDNLKTTEKTNCTWKIMKTTIKILSLHCVEGPKAPQHESTVVDILWRGTLAAMWFAVCSAACWWSGLALAAVDGRKEEVVVGGGGVDGGGGASEIDHLRALAALAGMVMCVGVVTAAGDGVVVVVEDGGRGCRRWWWWSPRRIKRQSGVWNNDKNGMWKSMWKWPFLWQRVKGSFFFHFSVHSWKMKSKMSPAKVLVISLALPTQCISDF